MQSEVKTIPDQKLGVINYKGPFSDLDILLSHLLGWVEAENIQTEDEPFIVYFSPRHEVNQGEAIFDVSIVIKDDAEDKELVRVVDMLEHKVLSGKHYGSPDNIRQSYKELVEIAEKNNYDIIGSPKEILIKNVHNCDNPDDFITEIQLPIIEM